MKNLVTIALVIALFGSGAYIVYYTSSQRASTVAPVAQESSDTEEENTDKLSEAEVAEEENSCPPGVGNGSCGVDTDESPDEDIVALLAEKYAKNTGEVSIMINKKDDNCIKGGVEFFPGGPENSGMFLAVNVNEAWEIAFDGNGIPDCSNLINQYNCSEEVLSGICE